MSTSQILEVGKAERAQGANHNDALKLRSAYRVQSLHVVDKLGDQPIPAFVRDMRRDNLGNGVGDRVYVLNDLVKLTAHDSPRKKNLSVAPAIKDAACIVAGCLVIMCGPILSALGVIKG